MISIKENHPVLLNMKISYLNIFILFIIGCKQPSQKAEEKIVNSKTTTIEVLDYSELAHHLEKQNDTTYVINFWATWCKPCVEELPAFEKMHAEIGSKKQKLLLVSLDFPNQIEKQLIPFIKKRNLQPEVIVLSDPDTNTWIPKVSPEWSGAIPATLVYNKNKKLFFEESFDYNKLQNTLKQF